MENPNSGAAWEYSSAAELRHSLRTSLNHIIGYGEMFLEELEEDNYTGTETADAGLRTLVSDARELVKSLQSAPIPDREQTGKDDWNDLRSWLLPRVEHLSANLERFASAVPERFEQDLNKIRVAVERLLAFGQNRLEDPTLPLPETSPDDICRAPARTGIRWCGSPRLPAR